MDSPALPGWPVAAALLAVAGLVLSALLTWLGIVYARHRRLIDWPGRRRSHDVPTPRGGGIGMAVTLALGLVLTTFWLPSLALPATTATALLGAVVLVASVGWIDDHGGLAARWRILVHAAAAALIVAATAPALVEHWPATAASASIQVATAFGLWLAVIWSINLHNFMDGINGVLAVQALYVLVVLALLLHLGGAPWIEVAWLGLFAAVSAGFLPFNFPRARIFMGDVGSGVLGLLVAVAVLWQMATPGIALASGLVACSAFVTDATCTLLSRMGRGRRWYSAHREHLYQWLVRCGHSHAQVVAFYTVWNLVIVLPVVLWMNREPPVPAISAGTLAATCAVYALATATWCLGKRACLRTPRARRTHAPA